MRPIRESLPRRSLSSIIDGGRGGEVIENVSKLLAPEGSVT
jgi:hypothetical protein